MNSDHPSAVLQLTGRLTKPSRLLEEVRAAAARVIALREEGERRAGAAEALHAALVELDRAHDELHLERDNLHAHAHEISNASAALEHQRLYYQSLFRESPEACLVTDQLGEVLDANRRAQELLQLDFDQTPRQRLSDLVAAGERTRLHELLQKAWTRGTALRCELEIAPRRSTTPISIHASVGLFVPSSDGSPQLQWILRPLALPGLPPQLAPAEAVALRQCQSKLEQERRAHAQAATTLRENQSLLQMLAHELRTPLSAIMGWAEILDSKRAELLATERVVHGLRQSACLLARLLEDLVDNTRAAQGKLNLEMSPLSLPDLVERVLEEQRGVAEQRSIRLSPILDRSLPDVDADPFRLEQVLNNVLESALKFTDLGGGLQIKLAQRGRCVELTVRDSSSTDMPEPLVSVFDAFVQVQRGEAGLDGLGLGLVFARRIVELHGGTFSIAPSGAGRSGTFTVRLPLRRSQSATMFDGGAS